MEIHPSFIVLALQALIHLTSAAQIASERGAGILETYVSLFGVKGSTVEDLFDEQRMAELAQARLAKISSPEYKETHIVTEMSPLQQFERQTLKLRSSKTGHLVTEECGRFYFSSIDSLRFLTQQHLNTLQLRIEDLRTGNKATADDEIDVITAVDEEMMEEEHDIQKIVNWTAHLEREKLRMHAMESFVTGYPVQFIVPSVDIHSALGVRTTMERIESIGENVTVSIIDHFDGVLPRKISAKVAQIVPKVLSTRPDIGNHLVNILTGIVPKAQVQACHMPLLAMKELIKSAPVAIDKSSSWMGTREIFNLLFKGIRQFTIMSTMYTANETFPIIGDIVQICLAEFEGKIAESYAERIVGLAHLARTVLNGAMIVSAAGDSALYQDNGSDDLTKLVQDKSSGFLNVVGLAQDGLHLASYTNQPGSMALGKRTLAAISHYPDLVSTSSAAAYVSGCAATLKSLFPLLSNQTIANCLLQSATPIVLFSSTKAFPFSFPLALEAILAKDFRPGVAVKIDQHRVNVTMTMFEESRKKYGMGRVNLAGAIKLAQEL